MNAWNTALALFVLSAPVFAQSEPQKVTFTSEDGLTLSGTFYKGGANFVVLSSQHHASQFAWRDFAVELADQGYSVLTYDYRGIGDSQGEQSVDLSVRDVTAAYRFVQSKGAKAVVMVGASLGASLTYRAAIEAKGTILLSPGLTVENPAALKRPGGPLLFVTSSYDFSRKETEGLFAVATEPKQLFIARGQEHGNGIVDGNDERVKPLIYDFLKKAFR